MNVLIVGAPSTGKRHVSNKCNALLFDQKLSELTILHGEGSGTLGLGRNYGIQNGLKTKEITMEYSKYGIKAMTHRNYKLAQIADYVIVFSDGEKNTFIKDAVVHSIIQGAKIKVCT